MSLSISSVLTTNILITLLIFLFCLLIKKNRILRFIGIKAGIIFLICLTLRILLPVEFFYTKSLYFKQIFTTLESICNYKIDFKFFYFSVYQLWVFVWIVVALIIFWRKIKFYWKIKRLVSLCDDTLPPDIEKQIQIIRLSYPELIDTPIYMKDNAPGPMLLYGKKQIILMPKLEYTYDELCYILYHEALHIRQKDFVWKLLIDIITVFYWWNPVFKLLRNMLFDLIEINIDLVLTNDLSIQEKKSYMECLEHISETTLDINCIGTICFSNSTSEMIRRRFYYIVHGINIKRKRKLISYLLIIMIMFITTCVIFEPQYSVQSGVESFTDENTYAIYEDGFYDIYLNGQYLITERSLEYYPFVHNIYYKEEEER